MNVAFLFNSDDSNLGGWYGGAVLKMVLKNGVLRSANRNMRVRVGDILTFSYVAEYGREKTYRELEEFCAELYTTIQWNKLLNRRLERTFGRATVYCWVFQNMTLGVADELHAALLNESAYLGCMAIDLTNSKHLHFFRNLLCEKYRIHGCNASLFYELSDNEDPDLAVKEIFESNGFRVSFEDIGGRNTIFDNYYSPEHFRRVNDFERVFAQLGGWSEGLVSQLVLELEDLHPGLFDVLAASARTLERAETKEDLAQVALSGRRFLENFIDILYPPTKETLGGHSLGKDKHKNRMWAYLSQLVEPSDASGTAWVEGVAKTGESLLELFNKGLHHNLTREKIEDVLSALADWTHEVINRDPARARGLYVAYEVEFRRFYEDLLKESQSDRPGGSSSDER